MEKDEIRKHIEKYNRMDYFITDPIAVVRRATEKRDTEILGIICSWLALGNRNQIFKHCNLIYDLMDGKPYEYLQSGEWRKYKELHTNLYRMFFYNDFYDLMSCLYSIYQTHPDMESAIMDYITVNDGTDYLDALIGQLKANGIPKNKKSACKRLVLFLRWMIRRDKKVDLGIWQNLDPSQLLIPLDVHVGNTARSYGLLTRQASDMKAVVELTNVCRSIYPDDPAIVDFALFGLGYTQKNNIEKPTMHPQD